MTETPGDKIIEAARALETQGFAVEWNPKGADLFLTVRGAAFRVLITINPTRWLGAELMVADSDKGEWNAWFKDTDLYRIDRAEDREFAEEIENEIVALLAAIRAGNVRVGRIGRRLKLVFPAIDGGHAIMSGRRGRVLRWGMTTIGRHGDEIPEFWAGLVPIQQWAG